MRETNISQEHLGDGVYVAWNGWAVELRVNSHHSAPVAFLEPQVLAGFDRWRQHAIPSPSTADGTAQP